MNCKRQKLQLPFLTALRVHRCQLLLPRRHAKIGYEYFKVWKVCEKRIHFLSLKIISVHKLKHTDHDRRLIFYLIFIPEWKWISFAMKISLKRLRSIVIWMGLSTFTAASWNYWINMMFLFMLILFINLSLWILYSFIALKI